MRKWKFAYYDSKDAGWSAHLVPVGAPAVPRTACNRAVIGLRWRLGDRPPGRVRTCTHCVERVGACTACGAPVDAHFDEDNRWTGCAKARQEVTT